MLTVANIEINLDKNKLFRGIYRIIFVMNYKEQITNRLIIITDELFSGNKSSFGKIVGYDESRIRSYTHNNIKERSMPTSEFIAAVVKYVEVNPEWLLLGEGEMIRSNHDPNIVCEPSETYRTKEDRLLNIIASQQRTIENLSKRGINTADIAKIAPVKKIK